MASRDETLERIATAAEGILEILSRKLDVTEHDFKPMAGRGYQCTRCTLTVIDPKVGQAYECR